MLSTSETKTLEISRMVWESVKEELGQRAILFALTGPLGAGKTRLVKGLAMAIGIGANVVSPTYVLETEYKVPQTFLKFVHLDAYRLESEEELTRIGFERRIRDKSVIALEWADKFPHFLDQFASNTKIVWIDIKPGAEENSRDISWKVL